MDSRRECLYDSKDVLQRFLTDEDLTVLEKPLAFEKTNRVNYYNACLGWLGCVASLGITAVCTPLTLCPSVMYNEYDLKLDNNAVTFHSAANDCCCHVATSKRTVPLEKIQDVEIQESWLQTCFGLKQVNVQTAGQGGMGAEVEAIFCSNPQEARDAIQLATRLHREAATSAPGQLAMQRSAAQGSLLHRLQCLEQLVGRGVLTAEEANGLRVAVLTAESDPLLRLREAADLVDRQVITHDEFVQVKGTYLAAIQRQANAA